jgi:hypothetical protein
MATPCRDTAPKGDALYLNYSYGNRTWRARRSHSDIDRRLPSDLGFISQVGYDKT